MSFDSVDSQSAEGASSVSGGATVSVGGVGGGVDDGADFVGPPPFFSRRLFFSRWSISALARVLFLVVVSWDVVMLVPVGLFVGVHHASFLKISERGMSPHS